jgi:hypothetical protein
MKSSYFFVSGAGIAGTGGAGGKTSIFGSTTSELAQNWVFRSELFTPINSASSAPKTPKIQAAIRFVGKIAFSKFNIVATLIFFSP